MSVVRKDVAGDMESEDQLVRKDVGGTWQGKE